MRLKFYYWVVAFFCGAACLSHAQDRCDAPESPVVQVWCNKNNGLQELAKKIYTVPFVRLYTTQDARVPHYSLDETLDSFWQASDVNQCVSQKLKNKTAELILYFAKNITKFISSHTTQNSSFSHSVPNTILADCAQASDIKNFLTQQLTNKITEFTLYSQKIAPQRAAEARVAKKYLKLLEGEYRLPNTISVYFSDRQDSGDVDVSDDLVIMALSATRAYIAMNAGFDNGHICSIDGVFEYINGQFKYQNPEGVAHAPDVCRAAMFIDSDKMIRFDDDKHFTCQNTVCGLRGRFDAIGFPLSSRKISTPLSPENSQEFLQEYQQALQENASF